MMTIGKAALFILLAGSVAAFAQVANTPNTLKLGDGGTSAKATLADVAWLAGSWVGTGLGGVSDEVWAKPAGGVMVGTYRLIKDGKAVFYEMCWILESEGTIVFRLKHFNADLSGWEEKDKTTDFKYVKREGNRVYFSGLTYELIGKDRLKIYLALKQRDGTVKEELFEMKRR